MFFKTTTDSIVSSFHKTIDKLNAHAFSMRAKAEDHMASSLHHESLANDHHEDADRAHAIATKLSGIIN